MKKVWITKDGTRIKIKDMSDSHLLNTLKMLLRKAEQMKAVPYPSFQGDMAQFYAESNWESLQEADPAEIASIEFPHFDSLFAEAERRKLDLDELDITMCYIGKAAK